MKKSFILYNIFNLIANDLLELPASPKENVMLQKPTLDGQCPTGYNLEYKVEKVISPEVCIYPDTKFEK